MARCAWTFVVLAAAPGCTTSIAPESRAEVAKGEAERAPANFYAEVAGAAGNYKHDTSGDGGSASGDTDGRYLALRAEYVGGASIGGGISVEGTASDDQLFADAGSPDAKGSTGDVFVYFVGVPRAGDRFRIPLRVGPYFHRLELKEDSSSTKIDWDGIGLRIEASPEWWLLRRDDFSFGLAGDLSIGAHATSIDAKSSGFSDNFDGNGWTFGAGLGVAAMFGNHVTSRLGYVYRTTNEAESDASNGIFVREATQTFRGVILAVGVRF
jgi:hypothetical protein